jgi:predicted nuclease with TOPRIM domain
VELQLQAILGVLKRIEFNRDLAEDYREEIASLHSNSRYLTGSSSRESAGIKRNDSQVIRLQEQIRLLDQEDDDLRDKVAKLQQAIEPADLAYLWEPQGGR